MSPAAAASTALCVDCGAHRLHYTVHGEGPPAVLLHGAGPGANGLDTFEHNLAALGTRRRLYVLDLPGWGRSSKTLRPGDPFGQVAEALPGFLDALGLARVDLVGVTLGATAALRLAIDHPQRVGRLALLAPAGGVVPGATGPTEGTLQLLRYYLDGGPTLAKLTEFSAHWTHDPARITPALLQQRFQASLDPEVLANPPLALTGGPPPAPLSLDPRLATLAHPVLLLWGRSDRINPVAGAASFQQALPQADVLLLAQAAHWAQWERPQAFNHAVCGFLAGAD